MNASAPILVCAPNWLGDAVMAMPAVQAFAAANPEQPLVLLSRPGLVPLWRMTGCIRDAITLPAKGMAPIFRAARAIRVLAPCRAYIHPASPRATFPPWLARVPERIAFAGHWPRRHLLTRILPPLPPGFPLHQTYETYALLGLPLPPELPFPRLAIPPDLRAAARDLLAGRPRPFFAILPGAARGPSKQWPPDHYAAAARDLARETGGTPVLLGSPAESPLCRRIAAETGGLDLSGATTLPQLAALLAEADVVLCNDSGGMHLAAAVGTPLVAMLGITDPARTGPLSPDATVLQKSDRRSRDIPRDSPEARAALAAITPAEVVRAALSRLR